MFSTQKVETGRSAQMTGWERPPRGHFSKKGEGGGAIAERLLSTKRSCLFKKNSGSGSCLPVRESTLAINGQGSKKAD